MVTLTITPYQYIHKQMAYMSSCSLTFIFTIFLFYLAQCATIPPHQHGMSIIKDVTKSQYFTTFIIGDPPIVFSLLVDLGSLYSWVACDHTGYNSTTYHHIQCGSAKCSAYAGSEAPCLGCTKPKPTPSCTNNTCGVYAYTPWSHTLESSGLLEDEIFLYTRPPKSPKVLQYPLPNFPFACASKTPLKGVSANAEGILTLSNVNIALHFLISKTFRVPHKFALCLPSTNTILYKGFQGALYFGGGPYYMSKENKIDFSKSLVTTPLVTNPISTAPISGSSDKSVEYFINVKSIEVEGTPLKFDYSLLSINKAGNGGTKLSTLSPYTVLHRSIYKALVEVFTAKAKAMHIPRIAAVAPFGACYNSRHILNITSGPKVPTIDFVLEGSNAKWRLYGSNLMVKFFDIKYRGVSCLGFMDGGSKTTTSIVIGGKQMEDNLVEIDLAASKVGITSAPASLGLSCSQFQSTLPTF